LFNCYLLKSFQINFFLKSVIKKLRIYFNLRDVSILTYTGCLILKILSKYFFSEAFSEKMFQTKVVWVEGRHKSTDLILTSLKSDQSHTKSIFLK